MASVTEAITSGPGKQGEVADLQAGGTQSNRACSRSIVFPLWNGRTVSSSPAARYAHRESTRSAQECRSYR